MSRIFCGLLVVALAGCQSSSDADASKSAIAHNDFESVVGWGAPAGPSLTTEFAHSGKWAVKVGPEAEYALGYSRPMALMVTSRPKKLKISGWFYLPDLNTKAALVCQVLKNGGENVMWKSLEVAQFVKTPNQWTYAEQVIDVPATLDIADECRFYLWRGASTAVAYADDLTLEAAE